MVSTHEFYRILCILVYVTWKFSSMLDLLLHLDFNAATGPVEASRTILLSAGGAVLLCTRKISERFWSLFRWFECLKSLQTNFSCVIYLHDRKLSCYFSCTCRQSGKYPLTDKICLFSGEICKWYRLFFLILRTTCQKSIFLSTLIILKICFR